MWWRRRRYLLLEIDQIIARSQAVAESILRELPGHDGLANLAGNVVESAKEAERCTRAMSRPWSLHRLPPIFLFTSLIALLGWIYLHFVHVASIDVAISSTDATDLQARLEASDDLRSKIHVTEGSRQNLELLAHGEVVSARILGPVPGGRLRIVPVGGGELDARISRFRRLLRRAHGQFLPEHPNLILFGTLAARPAAANLYALEAALLGTQVERWDRFPRKGHRVAHGRADDGFWHGRRHERSDFAGWFSAASDAGEEPGGWWDRESLAEDRGGAPGAGHADAPGDVPPDRDAGRERDARADEVREWLGTLLGPPQRALGL